MSSRTKEGFRLKLERRIRASRERVFRAWTDPDDLARWSAPEGLDVAEGAVDLRVGGQWSVVMRDPEKEVSYHAVGEYREITPPERLVYTHRWLTDDEPVETVVTVEFRPDGDGTRVVLIQEGFRSEASRDGHESGWSSCLDQLERMFA